MSRPLSEVAAGLERSLGEANASAGGTRLDDVSVMGIEGHEPVENAVISSARE